MKLPLARVPLSYLFHGGPELLEGARTDGHGGRPAGRRHGQLPPRARPLFL